MILNNSIIKTVASLDKASHRRREGLFVVEGSKAVGDTLGHFELYMLACTAAWEEENKDWLKGVEFTRATARDLSRMSHLSTPSEVMAVYRLPECPEDGMPRRGGLILALDTIQDPGNLGTIIRTADWMGVRDIIASRETADCFAPKVVQATMGSIVRVRVHYCDLPDALARLRDMGMSVYGTVLGGDDLYASELPDEAVIVVGNEGKGISAEVLAQVNRRVTIPSYPRGGADHGESLNAAIATAITLAAFRFH